MSRLLDILDICQHDDSEKIPSKIDILIRKEINALLLKIKHSSSIQQNEKYFDILQKAQEKLADMVFGDEKDTSDALFKFIGECDRLDDAWLRSHLFEKIKSGEFIIEMDDQ